MIWLEISLHWYSIVNMKCMHVYLWTNLLTLYMSMHRYIVYVHMVYVYVILDTYFVE